MTNEPNDKPLHEWVRQTLHEHRPDDNWEADWERLSPRVNSKPRAAWWVLGAGVLCVLLVTGYFWVGNQTIQKPVVLVPPISSSGSGVMKHFEDLTKNLPKTTSSKKDYVRKLPQPLAVLNNKKSAEEEQVSRFERVDVKFMDGPAIKTNPVVLSVPPVVLHSPEEVQIERQMLTGQFGSDSTTYRLLSRNAGRWPQTIIVADMTTSMYPYSTQIFAWLKKNTRNPAIKGMVFFTDCDSLGHQTQGNIEGKMYTTREREVEKALPLLKEAARNTLNNHDQAENDVAALLHAQRQFPEAKHLVLIADNGAPPKDMHLLPQLQKPVHVVLCGTTGDTTQAFQSEYLLIAQRTRGSLHTLEDDLAPTGFDKSTWLKVGQHYYRYSPRRQRFKVTRFQTRPRLVLGLFWW
jgi:hypothetical protein